jgi:DNA-binding GntR family transcriptional regulator
VILDKYLHTDRELRNLLCGGGEKFGWVSDDIFTLAVRIFNFLLSCEPRGSQGDTFFLTSAFNGVWYTNYQIPHLNLRGVSVLDIDRIEAPLSLREIAYEALKEGLLRMDLSEPASCGRLDERTLSEKLGVSRTPLREAINRLAAEGFLKVIPRKGIYIVQKTKAEVIEILLIRSVLEGLAARLAAKRASTDDIEAMKRIFSSFTSKEISSRFLEYGQANIDFHERILKASQSKMLIDQASTFFDHMRWIRARAVGFVDRQEKMHNEHLQIVEAFEKRNSDLAEKIMRRHIEELGRYIEEKIEFPL